MISPKTFKDDTTRKVGAFPVGTGPFVFDDGSWKANEYVKVKKNPHYWQKDENDVALPYLDEITFRIRVDASTSISELTKGDLNALFSPFTDVATRFAADPVTGISTAIDRSEGTEFFLALNNAKGPFMDKNVRVAAAAAIDREDMIKTLYGGSLEIANGPTSKESPWGESSSYPTYDRARATQLLLAADGGKKVPVTITMIEGTESQTIGLYIKEQWDKVGFDATVELLAETPLAIKVITATSDVIGFNFWYDDDPDAMWHFLTSKNAPESGKVGVNLPRWRSPVAEKALEIGRSTTDEAKRKAAYNTVWDELGKDVPYFFLYHVPGTVAWGKNVHGIDTLKTPDGSDAKPFVWSTGFLTRTWLSR